MFIRNLEITNYKLFKDTFSIDFNIPDGKTLGSGLTILCGENGTGKSSILEAVSLAAYEYRSETFSIEYINNLKQNVSIKLNTTTYQVTTVLPSGIKFNAIGFEFTANKRKKLSGVLYGSLIVSGRKIIPETEQKDYELRCDGTTPWGQSRYEQPSILFLDKSRIYQVRKGVTNSTNFDYLLERLCLDLQNTDGEKQEYVLQDTHPLKKAFTDFEDVFHISLKLFKSNPQKQMENAFIASDIGSNIVKLDSLGSGFEMFFSILWTIYRSFDDKKDMIILLDEPELHLHPKMQQHLINLLKKYSSTIQIIITTHSPLFIKQLYGINPKFHILEKENGNPMIKDIKEQKIKNFLSLNEVNFMAFGLYTEEYFNELYETLYKVAQENDSSINNQLTFDEKFFVTKKFLTADKPYKANCNNKNKQVTFITYIRNVIHHRVDYNNKSLDYTQCEFQNAVNAMRDYIDGIKNE